MTTAPALEGDMWVLIWHDTHTDPDVYVGTEQECQQAFVELLHEYLSEHPWPSHKQAARRLRVTETLAEQVEWGMEYANEHVEYIKAWLMELESLGAEDA